MSSIVDILQENYKNNYKQLYDITGKKPDLTLSSSSTIEEYDRVYTIKSYVLSKTAAILYISFTIFTIMLSYFSPKFLTYTEEDKIKLHLSKTIALSFVLSFIITCIYKFYFNK